MPAGFVGWVEDENAYRYCTGGHFFAGAEQRGSFADVVSIHSKNGSKLLWKDAKRASARAVVR